MRQSLRHTPLHDWHLANGARMVAFAGWDMPVYYRGVTRETVCVREGAGLFDVSHMGRLQLTGAGALPLLQWLTVNDVSALADGAGQYSLLLRPDGGILDDVILFRRAIDDYLLVVNASNRAKILSWILEHSDGKTVVADHTPDTGLIALQGPTAAEMVGDRVSLPQRFHATSAEVAGVPCTITRTGYTGEDGVEIVAPAAQTRAVWEYWIARGAEPCGLGARDTLRLEAAYCLYGHEIDESVTPLEAGLQWVVKWDNGDFVGRSTLETKRQQPLSRRLQGLVMHERSVPRQGQLVRRGEEPVGTVTSGTFSPTLGTSIALAYLNPDVKPGEVVEVAAPGKNRTARVQRPPFYRAKSSTST